MDTTDYDIVEDQEPAPSTAEIQELVVLMAAEGKTPSQIAEATGLDRRRISEIKIRHTAPHTDSAKRARDRDVYRKELLSLLPVKKRAEGLALLATSANPMIRLRALEMADEISQVNAQAQTPPALVPIFSLPSGTREPVLAIRPEPRKG